MILNTKNDLRTLVNLAEKKTRDDETHSFVIFRQEHGYKILNSVELSVESKLRLIGAQQFESIGDALLNFILGNHNAD
jgi:hypothetical protein